MEISTVLGLVGGFTVVLLTLLIEGGHVASFINFGALILILGGSVAVAVVSFSLKEVTAIPQYFMKAIFPPKENLKEMVELFVNLSERARREGLLSLEDDLSSFKDKMMRTGMELVVDGTDPEIVRDILEDYADAEKEHDKIPPELMETLGGFSPTLGIIGTVMGLVHVLEGLGGGGGIEQLGRGIAVAFIATFYGIGFANLLWLPMANKLKFLSHRSVTHRNIIIKGVMSIQSGDHPRVIREKLLCQISDPHLRQEIEEAAPKEGA
ncbi:MAG TPA: MotA/TolQ/ExbB proton channel family protein [Leptospiraceae bacterium]|jgi:chemotaxis protein MotA|nr:MotA/TolQ/ExbB proton channel family protein [Leptospirales bacterium]HMU83003.1 MotA/TolQ/ExbB proton channel family protein [Leptospiraceae bacterium]HMX56933.1 MotA/TolQ/ExbB proton channel family protein [Leptospiraceae bacterium]HMZ36548.1 MotA/TolQ/ExbB proton channel family protein [Leptospiraceae bacterium]HNE23796.1 MotA/TolQ/ExbB proton channel family protein [Leptospiraceae bacterium]